MSSLLFQPMEINGMHLKNRLVRSATWEAMATEDGMVTDKLVNLYTKLAQGGVGLIVLGYAYVHKNGYCLPSQTGIDSDNHIAGIKRITDAIHQTDTKVAAQLAHAGRQTIPDWIGGQTPMAPSAIEADPLYNVEPRAMTVEEIHETIDAFGQAARRAKEAGCDAVQLHAAHGYLLAQFSSPHTNRRTDEWGGNVENRMRFVIAVYKKVREAVGDYFPVLIKMSVVEETIENGLTIDDACKIAQKLAEVGIDAIEISGATVVDTIFRFIRGDIPIDFFTQGLEPAEKKETEDAFYSIKDEVRYEEAYWLQYTDRIKSVIGDVPLILVGGMKYPHTMEKIVQEKKADMISLSRALIKEPNLPKEMAEGRKSPAKCASCNLCLAKMFTEVKPLRCYNY